MEKDFQEFIDKYESKVVDLTREANLAYFNASISGKEEDYKRAAELQLELNKIYSNKNDFEELKKFKSAEDIDDPILKRQLELIYNSYAGNQFDQQLIEEIINLSTKVEEKFATFRAEVDGKKLTDNEIDDVLIKSNDQETLKKTWEASKNIGSVVADDVIKLVKMRNEAAQSLGFENYHQMSLELSEQNTEQLENLFNELNEMTNSSFKKLKDEIDEKLAKKFNIDKNELMPWHYQDKFFQQGPKIYEVDLDSYFADKDPVEITKKYFEGIGLDINNLIEKSDLYEKEGKYQHAYCTHVDRCGDVRVVCNVKPNHKWVSTLLHEYGHSVYDKNISMKLPWQLRQPAHIFATEAIAMIFGRFASNPQWLKDVVNISEQEKEKIADDCRNSLKLEQLVFSRWMQVMFRFEKGMYENPEQDLNKFWWDLVEKYQLMKKPEGRNEPDWASKIHVALYPAYYHNYMLGELLASQLYFYIKNNVLKTDEPEVSFAGSKDVGDFLKHLYFSYGALYDWDDLIENATGEKLTPKYYAEQFVG